MASTGAGLRTTFGAHHAGRTVPFRSNRCNIRAWIKPAKHERDHEHDWSSPHALAIEEIAAEALQDLPSMMESKDMDSRWDWESGRPSDASYEGLKPSDVDAFFGYPSAIQDAYEIGPRIGKGGFGTVRLVRNREEGTWYAAKALPKVLKDGTCSRIYLEKLRNEVLCMKQLGASLDAVYLKHIYEDRANLYLVQDVCAGGSLLHLLRRSGNRLSEERARFAMRGILRFLQQCHAKGIVYRDVKPANFLFLTRRPDSPLKASDLGLAVRWRPSQPRLRAKSGTVVYMAPEVLLREYGHECDLWSAGATMHELLTGSTPFWEHGTPLNAKEVVTRILTEDIKFDDAWCDAHGVSAEAADLLSRLMDKDVESRITAAEALKHPWIVEGAPVRSMDECRLGGTVLQRLQRFATQSHLMKLVLHIIMHEERAASCSSLDSFGSIDETMGKGPDGWPDAELLTEETPTLMSMREEAARWTEDVSSNMGEHGALRAEGLYHLLGALGYQITATECQHLFEQLDVDEDGAVTQGDLEVCLLDWERLFTTDRWEMYVDRAFDHLDANRNGTVTVDKVVTVLAETINASGGESHWSEDGWAVEDGARRGSLVERARDILREVGSDDSGDWRLTRRQFHEALRPILISDDLGGYDCRSATSS